jgi:peptidoglycan/LPS O-acetylase OafA/YrhL
MASIRFRHDINALRAIAVTAVVLFHFKLSFVPGGFVGVDIFFVISGYLMTQIITRRLAKGAFSLAGFYSDRTKRIVPPLYAMVLSLFVLGYFFIDPYSYQKLGSTGISALLFFSNFRFWEATGYFDATSATKWLLHTWSLSVEWQFYLLYPILLMLLARFTATPRSYIVTLWLLTLLSLGACIGFSSIYPSSTFYLLPFRAWEMLAGGLVALQFDNGIRDKRWAYALLGAGLVFIFIAIFTFDEHSPWPSYLAVLPVLGTCLIIIAQQSEIRLFANPICGILGAWSYSIYLWHWPLAVATVYFKFQGFKTFNIAGHLIIATAIVALCIYLATRLRQKLARRQMRAFAAGASAVLVTIVFSSVIAASDGLPNRVRDGQQLIADYKITNDWTYPAKCSGLGPNGQLRPCHVGEDRPDILFIGDSFAMQLYPHFTEALVSAAGRSVTFLTIPGCPALLGVDRNDGLSECRPFMNKAFDLIDTAKYPHVVLMGSWVKYFSEPNKIICFEENGSCRASDDPSWFTSHLDAVFAATTHRLEAAKARGIDFSIIASTPFNELDLPIELVKRKFFGLDTTDLESIDRAAFEKSAVPANSRLEKMAAALGAPFMDPLQYLCDMHRCAMVDQQGLPLFIDAIHYRSEAVQTKRFEFLNEAAGLRQNERNESAR